MGGGGFGRAYASGSNTKINQAALAKAAARAPKTVGSVIKKQEEEFVNLGADPFASTVDTFPSSTEFTMVDITDGTGKVIGQSRQPVVTGGGGAKLYSDMSMAERKVVDEARDARIAETELRREEQRAANPDFNLASFYESSLASADTSAEAKRKVLTAHDPGRGALYGTTPSGYLLDQQVGDPFIEAVRTYEVPLTQKADSPIELDYDYGYDADNLYMKQPPLLGNTDLQQGFTDEEREQYRDLMDRGSFIDISGGTSKVGEYSMVWVEDPPEPSGVSKFLNNPVLSVIGMLNPAIGLATTTAKAATGEKLSPVEIASSMLSGLQMAGVIKAPATFDNGEYGGALGGVDPFSADLGTAVADAGTGLFGSTFAQTQTALNVAAAGDAEGAALALVGDKLITGGLDKVGLDQATIENAGIQYDDFQAGVGKVVSEVAGGTALDDALVQGLGKYIREGGTLGSVDLPSVDLGIDLSGLKAIIEPIVETVEDIGRPIVKLVEDAGRPVVEAVEDVARPVGDIVEDVAQGAGDVLSDLDTAVRQALPDIDLPSVNLPSLDLNLGGLLTGAGAVAIPQLSATRTTDDLFKDELFKFQTEIGVDVEPLEYVDLNAPAENFFEDPILGRSYNF